MAEILVVDDESGIREFIADTLSEAGHEIAQAGDAIEALHQLEDRPFDLMIVDLRMPGELGGMDVVRRARAEWPGMQIVVLTAYGSVETAVKAMKLGAFDFLEKPLRSPAELRRLATRALNWRGRGIAAPQITADANHVGESPEGTSKVQGLLRELKRRHVYTVAATYAAAAFVVLQAAELILPALPLAGWVYSALVGLTIAGFLVALVLGWIYDIIATGMKRTNVAPTEINV